MSRRSLYGLRAVTIVLAWLAAGGWATAQPGAVSISVDRWTVVTSVGGSFTIHTTIANPGTAPAGGLVAHLNVLSLRDGVYVDPEDWSSHRTRYLEPIPPGGTTTTAWGLKAVNAGTFAVYVAVLPVSSAARPPITGPAVRISVAGRSTLDPGGILPLAVGIPALIAAATAVQYARRRRRV
ncbi:MAG: hypothetical protein ACXVY5_00400 [Gaiellales bacterium]